MASAMGYTAENVEKVIESNKQIFIRNQCLERVVQKICIFNALQFRVFALSLPFQHNPYLIFSIMPFVLQNT